MPPLMFSIIFDIHIEKVAIQLNNLHTQAMQGSTHREGKWQVYKSLSFDRDLSIPEEDMYCLVSPGPCSLDLLLSCQGPAGILPASPPSSSPLLLTVVSATNTFLLVFF